MWQIYLDYSSRWPSILLESSCRVMDNLNLHMGANLFQGLRMASFFFFFFSWNMHDLSWQMELGRFHLFTFKNSLGDRWEWWGHWTQLGSMLLEKVKAAMRAEEEQTYSRSLNTLINIKHLVLNSPVPKHDIASLWNDSKHKHPS